MIQRNAMKIVPSKRTKRDEFLAGYLPYLLNRVARDMLRGVDRRFQQHGLTVSKWRVLAVLSDRGKCGFGELARLTSIEPSTLSRFIDALIREGLVRRRRSTADARTVAIALTEKGEIRFEGTLPWALDVQNKLTHQIDPKDVALLQEMLRQMYVNVHTEFVGVENDDESVRTDTRLVDS